MFYKSRTITPVINQTSHFDNHSYHSVNLAYSLNSNVYVGLSASYYRGWTSFNLETESWIGNGSSHTDIFHYSVFAEYNLLGKSSKVVVAPQIRLIFEQSIVTFPAGTTAYIDDSIDPNFEGPIILEPFNSTQLIPALGLDIDWNFFWRLHLHANAYYAWGHKPFQKYYFEYTYDGVQQPTAEWHSDGTGLFTTIGLGFQLWGYKKQNENEN